MTVKSTTYYKTDEVKIFTQDGMALTVNPSLGCYDCGGVEWFTNQPWCRHFSAVLKRRDGTTVKCRQCVAQVLQGTKKPRRITR